MITLHRQQGRLAAGPRLYWFDAKRIHGAASTGVASATIRSGHTLTQADAAKQPTIERSDGGVTRSYVKFVRASSQHFSVSSVALGSLDKLTIYFVANLTNSPKVECYAWVQSSGNFCIQIGISFGGVADNRFEAIVASWSNCDIAASAATIHAAKHVITVQLDKTAAAGAQIPVIRIDGASSHGGYIRGAAPLATTFATATGFFGTYGAAGGFTDGNVHEQLIYSGLHTTAQMQKIEAELKREWGTP